MAGVHCVSWQGTGREYRTSRSPYIQFEKIDISIYRKFVKKTSPPERQNLTPALWEQENDIGGKPYTPPPPEPNSSNSHHANNEPSIHQDAKPNKQEPSQTRQGTLRNNTRIWNLRSSKEDVTKSSKIQKIPAGQTRHLP